MSVDIAEVPDPSVSKKFAALIASTNAVRVTYSVSEKLMVKAITIKGINNSRKARSRTRCR